MQPSSQVLSLCLLATHKEKSHGGLCCGTFFAHWKYAKRVVFMDFVSWRGSSHFSVKGHIPYRRYLFFSLKPYFMLEGSLQTLSPDFYCPVCHCPDLCCNCWNKYGQQEPKNNKTIWYTQLNLLHDHFSKLDMVGSLTIWSTDVFFKVFFIYLGHLDTLFHSSYWKEFKQSSMERKQDCN